MNGLYTDLIVMLEGPERKGFARPFAALGLSELARADRIEPFLTNEQRARLLDAGAGYVESIRDYRGFDEKEGWRHGVAHGADLMLQLSLNPALGRTELARIREAVAAQIAPTAHSYVFGESERLARPIFYMSQREIFTADEWSEWLKAAAAIDGDPFRSASGLARRHNLRAFLAALYVAASLNESAGDDALIPGLKAALTAVP